MQEIHCWGENACEGYTRRQHTFQVDLQTWKQGWYPWKQRMEGWAGSVSARPESWGTPPCRGYVLEEFHLPPAAPPARPHPGGAREARPRHGCTADSELQQLEAVSTHAPHVGSLETGSMQWLSWPPHRDKRVFLVQRCKFFFL